MRKIKGFTLIELLVVISIIGILVVVGAYGWSSVAARERDNTRKADLRRLQGVLEMFNADYRYYPVFKDGRIGSISGENTSNQIYAADYQLNNNIPNDGTLCGSTNGVGKSLINDNGSKNYISTIPIDPQSKNASSLSCEGIVKNQIHSYLYITEADNASVASYPSNYGLLATLEKNSGDKEYITSNPLTSTTTSADLQKIFGSTFYFNKNNAAKASYRVKPNYILTKTGS